MGQLLVGTAGEVEELDHINLFSFILLLCVVFFLSPPPQGISWFLKHSVGDILVKMQYFYVL